MKDILKNIFESDEQTELPFEKFVSTTGISSWTYKRAQRTPYEIDNKWMNLIFMEFTKINSREELLDDFWEIGCSGLIIWIELRIEDEWGFPCSFFGYVGGKRYPVCIAIYPDAISDGMVFYNKGADPEMIDVCVYHYQGTREEFWLSEQSFREKIAEQEKIFNKKVPYYKRK